MLAIHCIPLSAYFNPPGDTHNTRVRMIKPGQILHRKASAHQFRSKYKHAICSASVSLASAHTHTHTRTRTRTHTQWKNGAHRVRSSWIPRQQESQYNKLCSACLHKNIKKTLAKSTLAFLVDSLSRGTIYISRIVDGSLGGSILREHPGQSEMRGKINTAWVLILTFSLLHVHFYHTEGHPTWKTSGKLYV